MNTVDQLGRLLALIALSIQLAVTSFVLPTRMVEPPAVAQRMAFSICSGDRTNDGTPHRHQHPVCTVCPLCQAVAQAGALLAPASPVLAAPVAIKVSPDLPPPAHTPSARQVAVAFPRGPPRPV